MSAQSGRAGEVALVLILVAVYFAVWPAFEDLFTQPFHEQASEELKQYRSELSSVCADVGQYLATPPEEARSDSGATLRPAKQYRGLFRTERYQALLELTLDSLATARGEEARTESLEDYGYLHAYPVWRHHCVTDEMGRQGRLTPTALVL